MFFVGCFLSPLRGFGRWGYFTRGWLRPNCSCSAELKRAWFCSHLLAILTPPSVFCRPYGTGLHALLVFCFSRRFLFLTECTEETDAMWIFISNWCKKGGKYLLFVKKYITFAVVNINDCFMTYNSTYYRILGGFLIGGVIRWFATYCVLLCPFLI